MKLCRICKKDKDSNMYVPQKSSVDGLGKVCIDCKNKYRNQGGMRTT